MKIYVYIQTLQCLDVNLPQAALAGQYALGFMDLTVLTGNPKLYRG